jgi:hypothetical protein
MRDLIIKVITEESKKLFNNELEENNFYIKKSQILNQILEKINLIEENVTSLPIKIGTT